MDSDSIWQFIVLAILLLGSAFFSSSETALMSLSKINIRHMLAEGVKGAKLVHKITENPHKLLSTILVGNNIVNIGASAIATSLAIHYFQNKGVTISTITMTVLVLIFGEITPKSLAAQHSEKVSIKVSPLIHIFMIVLSPITITISYITNFLVRILGGKTDEKQSLITEEELKTMINVSHEEGVLEVEEREMIHNIFEFTDTQVKSVMIPRTDVCFIRYDASYNEIIERFRNEQYSRMPVYKDSLDDIVGVLHVKDLIFLEEKTQFNIEDVIKKPHFTYEFKRTPELFAEMRKDRIPLYIVLDEYGGTVGVITIEDLVEEIVGEIEDEYDEIIEHIQPISTNEFIVNGNVKIDVINELIGINIMVEEFDSIGGFVLGEFGRLPEEHEMIEYQGAQFLVEKVKKNRIISLRVKQANKPG